MSKDSKSLIINSPYTCPEKHWGFIDEETPPNLIDGRRQAGYMIADPRAKPHRDSGIFVSLPLVNQIRERVDSWRNAGYPGVTGITKTLLEHWKDNEQRDFPFFFCQVEAIETLIWLIESHDSEKTGIDVPRDGGDFGRLCSKLATGTGKTVVMAMLIAWQAINRATYPQDRRFSQHIFIVAPNLTVRERLSVLDPSAENNYYDEFNVVPRSLNEKLHRAKVLIRNWHALNWETEEKIKSKRGVDKRGAKSDEAYTREVLGDIASARNLIVINDEAHHAWRVPAGSKVRGVKKEEIEEATKWVGGLDRIHKTRGILQCFDFSATPFAPSGHQNAEEALFGWIVSDFGLNDAIESGLVKTPRVVVDDDALPDAKTYKSRLYHLYTDSEVKDDLNRKTEPHEPLPDLVINAYTLLGADWDKAKERWDKSEARATPPVMITVANRTETAARIKHAFDNNDIAIEALCKPEGMLHIDSKVLKQAEEKEIETQLVKTDDEANDKNGEGGKQKMTQKEQAALLRKQVNTVGQVGEPGENIQNVISVGMLSEGWDARTVTQIMGLRAFTSQLLCEQVIGRGLRRASYEINEGTGLFNAEYVNVFGVPFSFLPHEQDDDAPLPATSTITIKPVEEKQDFAISWPNVIRIDRTLCPELVVDWEKIEPLQLDTSTTVEIAALAPTVNNKPDVSQIKDIDLENLMRKQRRQTIIFKTAQSVWKEMQPKWPASPALLMAQLVTLAEQFIDSGRIQITPALFNQDEERKKLVITLNMSKVIRHFWQAIEFNNTDKTDLVLDSDHPIASTEDMRPWRTGKPCKGTKKSHINYCVFDSTWESSEAFELDRNKAVDAWVKNDHLGFDVLYVYKGVIKKYRPDFIIRLKSGRFFVIETKGQQTDQDDVKHQYMRGWVDAVNQHGGFGQWGFGVSNTPADIKDLIAAQSKNP